MDCSDVEFRTNEASRDQVLQRTTANESLRKVQQTRGEKGFEPWLAMVRRHDLRNMADKNSACAALVSNIFERDRATEVEQFDDILRTFINQTNNFENRFGTFRDEEKMLALKKLILQSLWNFRFCGTTMSYNEFLIALEISSSTLLQLYRQPETGRLTSAPKNGMASKDDGEHSREGDPRIVDLALQAVHKGTGKGQWSF